MIEYDDRLEKAYYWDGDQDKSTLRKQRLVATNPITHKKTKHKKARTPNLEEKPRYWERSKAGSRNVLGGDGQWWNKVSERSEKQFRDLRRGETMGKHLPTSEDL